MAALRPVSTLRDYVLEDDELNPPNIRGMYTDEHMWSANTLAICAIDKELLASSHTDGDIRVWNYKTGQKMFELALRSKECSRRPSFEMVPLCMLTPDTLACGSFDSCVALWNVYSRDHVCDLRSGHSESEVTSLCVASKSGTLLASMHAVGTLIIWDTQQRAELLHMRVNHFDWALPICMLNEYVICSAAGGEHDRIKLWDLRDGTCIKKYEFAKARHSCVRCFSVVAPDIVAFVSSNGTVRVINWELGELLHVVRFCEHGMMSVLAFGQKQFITSCFKNLIIVDLEGETKVGRVKAKHGNMIMSIIELSGTCFASVCHGNVIRFWGNTECDGYGDSFTSYVIFPRTIREGPRRPTRNMASLACVKKQMRLPLRAQMLISSFV